MMDGIGSNIESRREHSRIIKDERFESVTERNEDSLAECLGSIVSNGQCSAIISTSPNSLSPNHQNTINIPSPNSYSSSVTAIQSHPHHTSSTSNINSTYLGTSPNNNMSSSSIGGQKFSNISITNINPKYHSYYNHHSPQSTQTSQRSPKKSTTYEETGNSGVYSVNHSGTVISTITRPTKHQLNTSLSNYHSHHSHPQRHSSGDDSGNESQNLINSNNTSHFVVVAIDFGTTFSGYAFAFTRDGGDMIHMMRKWEGGDPGVINQKTPTTILLTPDGTFHSFGFLARDFFHDLDPDEAKKWLYFEKFKMHLHYTQDLNTQTLIAASNGRKVAALTIFTHALGYFKDHALRELSDQSGTRFMNEDVRWVITVPAIWRQPAKQFMREAAYQAGIASREFPDQLLIALEPEAASIYIRKLRMHQFMSDEPYTRTIVRRDNFPSSSFSDQSPVIADSTKLSNDHEYHNNNSQTLELMLDRGTRYMVVDCGGGTVDITVHELDNKLGTLKELYKATGGPFGSVGVDQEFEKLMHTIFGIEVMEEFKMRRPAGYVDLMIAFEARKRTASPYKNNPLNISLPFSFIDFYKKKKGSTVESAIRKSNDPEIKWSTQGMMRLTPEAMKRLFQPTVDKIKSSIGEVLNSPNVRGIQYLFLVGGFAESPILQHDIRRSFSSILKVIIPQDVSLTILKGAVLFGLDPTIVNVRRSRLTYGVSVLNRFIDGFHSSEKKIIKDNIEWCADIFDKFVLVDQSIGLGDTVIRKYTPARFNQAQCIISFYCSESDKPMYVTDSGVRKIGTLVLDMLLHDDKKINGGDTTTQRRREVQTRMVFGDTEIKVSALDVTTGKCVRATIDFLNK